MIEHVLREWRREPRVKEPAGAPIGDLVKLYDTTTDPQMKQALIGIYVRNGERAAVDKLISILRSEENSNRRVSSTISRSCSPARSATRI